jgi:hypothetical protein
MDIRKAFTNVSHQLALGPVPRLRTRVLNEATHRLMAQLEENFFNTKYLLRVWHLGLGLLFFLHETRFFQKTENGISQFQKNTNI